MQRMRITNAVVLNQQGLSLRMNASKLPVINNDKLRNWWDGGRTPEQKYQDIGVTFREKKEGKLVLVYGLDIHNLSGLLRRVGTKKHLIVNSKLWGVNVYHRCGL